MYDIKTPTLFDVAESRLSHINTTAIKVMLRYRGVLVYGYRPQSKKLETDVYGDYAKSPELWKPDRKPDFITRVLSTQDNFISFDNLDTSLLTGGFFLTDYPFKTGDIIQFRRKDSMRRFFSVSREVQMGVTTSVIKKFEFASYDA